MKYLVSVLYCILLCLDSNEFVNHHIPLVFHVLPSIFISVFVLLELG